MSTHHISIESGPLGYNNAKPKEPRNPGVELNCLTLLYVLIYRLPCDVKVIPCKGELAKYKRFRFHLNTFFVFCVKLVLATVGVIFRKK